MKNFVYALAFTSMLLVSCSTKQTQSEATNEPIPSTEQLRARLQMLVDSNKIAFGHHDDLSYGFRWEYIPDSSDVKNVTGDYPAIVNWDLGWIEMDSAKQLDGVPFDFMRENMKKHHQRGGINSISWHPVNPITHTDSWDTSAIPMQEIAQGGPMADTLRTWVGKAADFIGSIRDENGNRIPVIFRPWHEQTGDWFWWGLPHSSAQDYIALWKLTREVFDEKGIDNVLWAYSPDKSNCTSIEEYLASYPGDEFVDIFGADVYHFNSDEGNVNFNQWMSNMLTFATQLAKEKGKIAALTETGSEACLTLDWYCNVLYPAIKDYPIAYITVWRNSNTKPNHFYTPYKGHPAEQDFINFYNLPQTVFLKDLK